MPREGDDLEEYQIQGTYKPRDSVVSLAGKIIKAGYEGYREAQAREAARLADIKKNGHPLPGVTLDEVIAEFSRQGFEILYRDDRMCQMKQGKRFRGWQVIGVGVLTAGFSVVPHVLQQAGKRDKIILLRLDAEGRVRLIAS